jgi:hypothetical protein
VTHFRDRRDFDATIDAAAERLGVDPVIIEKDYWVSQILRGLADQYPGAFIFKGGTSLSKCYGLIQRFSEDIDLLIRPGERGRNSTDRMLKEMAEAAGGALDCPPESLERVESGLGEHRKVRIFYPTSRPGLAGVKPGVLLEMGIRGGEEPHQELPAGCLLSDILVQAGEDISSYDDLQPVVVPVLHPGRTLLEKLAVVHTKLGMNPSEAECKQYGRHYYDIHQLLGDGQVIEFLNDRERVDQVIAGVQEVTNSEFRKRGEPEIIVRPESGWPSSPAFDESNNRLADGYSSAMDILSFERGKCPEFADIRARVHEMAELL